MTVAYTERFFPPLPDPVPWDSWGQSMTVKAADGTPRFTLISYLTEPLPVGSRLDYVVLCHEDADAFEWTFSDTVANFKYESIADRTLAWTKVDMDGPLETRVVVKKGGDALATLKLTQNASNPDAAFVELQQKARPQDAQLMFATGEMVQDFKSYINDAAAATGPNGIPARLLAAILLKEATNRPKDGSPGAGLIRKTLDGESFSPRWQEIWKLVKSAWSSDVDQIALDDIRDVELQMIRGFLNEFDAGLFPADPRVMTSWLAGAKSLGVGQVAQTTAAMTMGLIQWRDIDTKARTKTLDAVKEDFLGLRLGQLRDVFTSLRFPKSNIALAAQLLAKLKNRPNRFPDLTPKEVLASPKAISLLATEYHIGGTSTPLADAAADDYGMSILFAASADFDFLDLTRFFPDPSP